MAYGEKIKSAFNKVEDSTDIMVRAQRELNRLVQAKERHDDIMASIENIDP